MIKLDGKKVKFIAIDKKYLSTPYPAVAPFDGNINNYITGQNLVPHDKDTIGFLTKEEIEGTLKVEPLKRFQKFSPLIGFQDTIMIIHNKLYDCTVNASGVPNNSKDYWDAHFIVNNPIVAMSKGTSTPKQKFYLDDKEADAKVFVQVADAAYEAEKLVREKLSINEYKDVLMFLNLYKEGFHVDYDTMSDVVMKEAMLKVAKDDPASIHHFFTETGENLLFLAKLVEKGIITRRTDGYYDANKFVSVDSSGFNAFVADKVNEPFVGKWGRLLKSKKK